MNSKAVYVGAALFIAVCGTWAGARLHSARLTANKPMISVPAGVASPPSAADAIPESIPTATIPDRLPAFALNDLSGKSVSVSTWAGRSLIINFWATWCAPCRREIPFLKTLSSQWSSKAFTVVGIAVDHAAPVKGFAERYQIPYPILVGEQEGLDVAAQFGMTSPAFPFTVFTDRRAEVVTLFVGELHPPQAQLILSVVDQLNRNGIDLAAARSRIASSLQALADKTART